MEQELKIIKQSLIEQIAEREARISALEKIVEVAKESIISLAVFGGGVRIRADEALAQIAELEAKK